MNGNILASDIQNFIEKHLKSDINSLILKGSPFQDVSIQELANQIIAKEKSEKKLPTWFGTTNIYYPPKISMEQCSSEITASYKAQLVEGTSLIDLTGGFGVDVHFFAKKFQRVVHCEINEALSATVAHNNKILKNTGVTCFAGDGLEFLKNSVENFDVIYIDPSRRHDVKGKVFLLKDCLPNVPENLDFLFEKAATIVLKNSPLLDIQSCSNELKFIKEIHVVALKSEVKELLFILEKNYTGPVSVRTVNLDVTPEQHFDFTLGASPIVEYSAPKQFLYEPNAAVLKSGGFQEVAAQYKLSKLHKHSHLYTSEELIAHFPGRIFEVEECFKYNKKLVKKQFPEKKANIAIRNFPKSVAQLRKETQIKDGGDIYAFFTTNVENEKISIRCKKILL